MGSTPFQMGPDPISKTVNRVRPHLGLVLSAGFWYERRTDARTRDPVGQSSRRGDSSDSLSRSNAAHGASRKIRKELAMALFIDVHNHIPGLTADAVAGAHQK